MLRVIAHQRVLGLKPGQEALVPDDTAARGLIERGRLTLVEEVESTVDNDGQLDIDQALADLVEVDASTDDRTDPVEVSASADPDTVEDADEAPKPRKRR